MGNSHYNSVSTGDQLLIHNTADGHFYEWWITNGQLQGVDLGVSVSTGVSGSSGTAASGSAGTTGSAMTVSANNAGAPSISPDSTSLLVQAMASFGSSGTIANSNSALLGPDPSQQSALATPIDGHLAHA
jgi:type V secretory pathway adhesin AidA